MSRKLVYQFEAGKAEGRAEWKELLGGKGANLAEMVNMGIPVPPGFTITADACVDFLDLGRLPDGLMSAVRESIERLEQLTGRQFGGADNPLLVSVRSGARSSMPGMMDTILNLGLCDESVRGLARLSRSPRFAYDAYRRLLAMYGDVVLGVQRSAFDPALDQARRAVLRARGEAIPKDKESLVRTVPDSALGARELEKVVAEYRVILRQRSNARFPSDAYAQLETAIVAVFSSWNNPRARLYRKLNAIPDDWGTAVNVQAMVFGNLGDTSATGVAFTRDPSTGERRFFGEWLPNAQGEDVVAGIRTPRPLGKGPDTRGLSLEEALPENYAELDRIQARLEQRFRDMQDIEFTIEAGRLYILQTRNGKRSARASVRIAVDMVAEGLLHPDEAILRVDPNRLDEFLFPKLDPRSSAVAVACGIAASPGAVSGLAMFSAEDAEAAAGRGAPVILVRTETSPEDLHGMNAARGILTARGGSTSHAAVVARGMGRPCVAGCSALHVDHRRKQLTVHGADGEHLADVRQGDRITIDGSTGRVYLGVVETVDAELGPEMETLLAWTERVSRMRVRANADTPAQAEQARAFGANGIGLCRTEHMFFDAERILAVREMILAPDKPAREAALAKILPYQTADFCGLFRVMRGLPVNIRLLDPPLHEFLPSDEQQVGELAKAMRLSEAVIQRRVRELFEYNPMLGHRGVRLGITFPEIPAMQVRAILEAACTVQLEGAEVLPEIMIPLAFSGAELRAMRAIVDEIASEVFQRRNTSVAFKFGTMIELPRAAILADQLAAEAEFFSFGTNDLTQTTLGISRDDAGSFIGSYLERHLLPHNPFVTLDREGVGELVRIAVEKGKVARSDISLGMCGEHGGDPASIEFCENVGLSYVSCSPFRVPTARVAAAQASLRRTKRYWR